MMLQGKKTSASSASIIIVVHAFMYPFPLSHSREEMDVPDDSASSTKLPLVGPLIVSPPKSTRNKAIKMRTSMMGFLGVGNFMELPKPRWRYQSEGEEVPIDPAMILKVRCEEARLTHFTSNVGGSS